MRTFLAAAVLSLFALSAMAEEPDSPESRVHAAERYLAVTDIERLFNDAIVEMTKNLPPEQRTAVRDGIKRHMRVDALRNAMMMAMVRNFTSRELDALAAFYGSEDGRSAMAKLPAYTADVMPPLMAEVNRAVAAIKAEAAASPKVDGT